MVRVLFTSEEDRLLTKQTNLYRLQTKVDELIIAAGAGGDFVLTEGIVRGFHKIAMEGLLTTPGMYRETEVAIKNSPHQPCPHDDVPPHMADMCEYLRDNWTKKDLVHLAAYSMWRINWIHPFENGNGRTARAASYLVLCAKYGGLLPARNTVIQQIIVNKQPYYAAHIECDKEYERTRGDMGCLLTLEELIAHLLKEQLKASLSL